jgi:5-methylthioadenosine/S-adenosylhomocysteine deaminase
MRRRTLLRKAVALPGAFLAARTAAAARSWRLAGTICTLNDQRNVLSRGVAWISGDRLASVAASADDLPREAQEAPLVETNGVIYPGLIDLHKHITYDIRGPWFPRRQFNNRTEFFNDPEYKSTVENPCRLLAQYMDLLNEVCLYAEVKALAGGTTALQGGAIYDRRYTSELVRNVEFENFGRDRVHQTIWDVDADSAAHIQRLMPQLDAWIYHLAEGAGDYARQRFEDLKKFGLIANKLVAIHCVGLTEQQFRELGRAGASMVWSPLGNLRLYGRTADLRAARRAGVNICLGSEWAPSGSKNLLTDLKVADQWNQRNLKGLFTDRELVEMVTVNPARAIGWNGKAGQLTAGSAADLLVLRKKSDDPYRNLIEATEESVALVVIDGQPLYGDLELMRSLQPSGVEILRPRRGSPKALRMGYQSFADLRARLAAALTLEDRALLQWLSRLKVRRALDPSAPPAQMEYPYFLRMGDEPLELAEVRQFLKAVFPEGVKPFELDPLFVADDDAFPQVARDPVLLKNGVDLLKGY